VIMSRDTAANLRTTLATAQRSGVGRAYPAELRERAAAYIRRRRDEGVSDQTIADEIGVGVMTFVRWVGPRRTSVALAFAPARVIEAAPPSRYTVHGPRGMRLEGLTVGDVAALWSALS